MFRVDMGTQALVVKGEGRPLPFYTRKHLIFLPRERIKADPGKLAFKRNGYVIILDSKDVTIPDKVRAAIESCLLKMRDLVLKDPDRQTIKSLLFRNFPLSINQMIMAAVLVARYRWLLPESDTKSATSILAQQRKKPDHG